MTYIHIHIYYCVISIILPCFTLSDCRAKIRNLRTPHIIDYSRDLEEAVYTCWRERFRSFHGSNWDKTLTVQPYTLALAGFYFRGTSQSPDCVQCFFCAIKLSRWRPNDTAIGEHLRHARHCAVVHRHIDQYHEYL